MIRSRGGLRRGIPYAVTTARTCMLGIEPPCWWTPSGRLAGVFGCAFYWCYKCDKSQPSDPGIEFPETPGDHGPGNAVRHCIRACNMMRNCKEECFLVGGPKYYFNVLWEFYNPKPRSANREMDIHNNSVGISCAAGKGSCVSCCLESYRRDKLTWF